MLGGLLAKHTRSPVTNLILHLLVKNHDFTQNASTR